MQNLSNLVTEALGIDFVKNQWVNAITAFKLKEREFNAAFGDLLENKQKYYAAGLKPQYDAAFAKGNVINNSIAKVINGVKNIYEYFTGSSQLNALPFVAAIPIGSIIGITALIGVFLTSYYLLQKGYTEYNIRKLPADQQIKARADQINYANAPVGAGISSSIYGIGFAIALVLILPKLMKGR